LLVSLVTLSYSQELRLPEGFNVVETSSPYKMVLTPYATYPVVLEEYVPKVVLEGKWGTGPGEFSYEDYDDDEGMTQRLYPSMAVNSKGEIYILDIMNNRIQKFDADGKYLKSISVPTRADKNGKSIVHVSTIPYFVDHSFVTRNKKKYVFYGNSMFYQGINIVFDSMDNLYCYVKYGRKGYVWKFSDDKTYQEYALLGSPKQIVRSDINGKVYELLSISKEGETNFVSHWYNFLTKEKESSDKSELKIERTDYSVLFNSSNEHSFKILFNDGRESVITIPSQYKFGLLRLGNCFAFPFNTIRVYTSIWVPTYTDILEFSNDGLLCGILLNPTSGFWTSYSIFGHPVGEAQLGNDGNVYYSFADKNTFKIIKSTVTHRSSFGYK